MIALLRYQAANLFRSHRWILPLILYVVLISVGGVGSGTEAASAHLRAEDLADGLDWSAGILVPVVAIVTRSMLTAEHAAARACVSAATGPARAQFATLLTALARRFCPGSGVLGGLLLAGRASWRLARTAGN